MYSASCWKTVLPLLALLAAQYAAAAGYPQRIVSLGPLNTENIYLLGAEDRLLADTSYCVRPEAARAKEKIGSVLRISMEKIIALRPDLVLATGLTGPQQINKLRDLGMRVVQVRQPDSFAAICAELLRLGRLLGLEERARIIVQAAKARVNDLQQRLKGVPEKKVLLQIGSQPLFGAAPGSFTHDFIRLAKGTNILADRQNGLVGYEEVLVKNPDVIIIAIMGTESGTAIREREKWQRFRTLNAVRNHAIYLVNPDLVCSPSPITFAEALEDMALLIHPELKETP